MTASMDERATRGDYAERYRLRASATVVDEAEREVIGDVWGANGFTTVDQAEDLRRRLELDTNSRLLDVGSGCGWPGLWLAQQTGCEVVVTDLPPEGLEVASRRAKAEGLRSPRSCCRVCPALSVRGRLIRCRCPRGSHLLTGSKALRAESLQTHLETGRAHGLRDHSGCGRPVEATASTGGSDGATSGEQHPSDREPDEGRRLRSD